ncbi:hypothetical protein VTJ49DRAFT_5013 [Mycothermus thermophilus]|uniref:DUF1479-domain-containing protein n=1 Tax=Humicola insolens TaxID=85995 RepID=A0ABR3VLR8_HUMIN
MAVSVRPLLVVPTMVDPAFRAQRVEPAAAPMPCPWPGPIQLTSRFATLKEKIVAGNEAALTSSFQRLLRALPEEIDRVSALGSEAIPVMAFADATNPQHAEPFLNSLRERGVGILRGVVPRETALAWAREAQEYASQIFPGTQPPPQDIFWSSAQVQARAHPNVLAAQKFVMSGAWRSADPRARVTTDFPITYADRMGTREAAGREASPRAHVDGGSVERWEPDGYGRAGTYRKIWQGRWEEYDPWESSTRLGVTSDLYHKASACSIFRMFQGWLAVNPIPPGPGSVKVCPLPRHATAYFLLRPFFAPSSPRPSSSSSLFSSSDDDNNHPDSTTPDEWTLNRPQNSILHGALPSYAQDITPSLHPHLDLARSLIPVPHLEPGDYLVWHPDLIHSVSFSDNNDTTTATTNSSSSNTNNNNTHDAYTHIYLPACPLTQTNALYLARQRKSFLAGTPGPDFDGASSRHRLSVSAAPSRRGSSVAGGFSSSSVSSLSISSSSLSLLPALGGLGGGGESSHPSRAGPTEVGDAGGGDDGLRAMGLVPWDEEDADEDETREVLAMANGILFPDLYDML